MPFILLGWTPPLQGWTKLLYPRAEPNTDFCSSPVPYWFLSLSLPKLPFPTFSPNWSAHPYFNLQSGISPPQEPMSLGAMTSGVWAFLNLSIWRWGGRAGPLSKCHYTGCECGHHMGGKDSGMWVAANLCCLRRSAWAMGQPGRDRVKFTRYLTSPWFQSAIWNLGPIARLLCQVTTLTSDRVLQSPLHSHNKYPQSLPCASDRGKCLQCHVG